MDRHVARHQPRRAGADAPAHRRLGGRLAHARVIGQPEVVVRAEQQHRAGRRAARAAPAAPRPAACAGRGRAREVLQPLLDVASRRLPRLDLDDLGQPRGSARRRAAVGTEVFLRWRSWRGGFQKLASSWRSISRRSACRGRVALEPAGAVVGPRVRAVVGLARDVQPELLEHRAVVLGLGAERGEEVAHHHAVQAGLDGQRLQLAEVLDRGRRRAGTAPPGRIRRKIAIHLTASHGSMKSRSPNLVPGRGLSRLIGTLVGRARRAGRPSPRAARATRRG